MSPALSNPLFGAGLPLSLPKDQYDIISDFLTSSLDLTYKLITTYYNCNKLNFDSLLFENNKDYFFHN